MAIISDELREVKALFAVPRRTEIADWAGDMEDEDLIEREDMVVTITSGGYIKRTPLAEFRARTAAARVWPAMQTKEDDVVTTLFVANTHTLAVVLHHRRHGLQAEDLAPAAGGAHRQGQGAGQHPADRNRRLDRRADAGGRARGRWETLQIVFATSDGDVRQNDLSDFTNVMRNGKIAMKLPEGVTLVNAAIADENDDIMLVTEAGRAIRFSTTEIRVFKSRGSTGVRGIRLAEGDHVVSMSIIRHFEATPEEREAYLKQRRLMAGITEDEADDEEETVAAGQLSPERYAEMSAAEDLILTVTKGGAGKLSSSHDYPVRGRGGMGVKAISPGPSAAAASSPPSRSRSPTRSCWPPHRPVDPGAGRPDQLPLALGGRGAGLQRRRRGRGGLGRPGGRPGPRGRQ
jgi:DNA gyrase subunit A